MNGQGASIERDPGRRNRRRRGEDDSDAPTPTGDGPAPAIAPSQQRERELAIVPGASVPGAEETSFSETLTGPTGNPVLVGVLCQ